jgi:adenylate cyclase
VPRAIWLIFRDRLTLLPLAVVGCFVLLSEALIRVAVTGERTWHASWWEWHGLILTGYLLIGFAAYREWRDERFRHLYLATTRQREQEVSVLFSDLAGFTSFAERSEATEVAAVLNSYFGIAAPLITAEFGGEVEKFIGDGVVAVFNGRGDQPNHAPRAAGAALALQQAFVTLTERHPDWPGLRVGVNSGQVVLREIGGHGHVAYPMVGDTINTGSRLEALAPSAEFSSARRPTSDYRKTRSWSRDAACMSRARTRRSMPTSCMRARAAWTSLQPANAASRWGLQHWV